MEQPSKIQLFAETKYWPESKVIDLLDELQEASFLQFEHLYKFNGVIKDSEGRIYTVTEFHSETVKEANIDN